jgi:diacylglycerol kinase (ATP)
MPLPDGATLGILINPAARRALDAEGQSQLRRALASRFVVKLFTAATAEAMSGVARTALAESDVVVVAGGDGTVNTVLNLADLDRLTLAILPLGTANDLARQLAIPLEPPQAIARILTGEIRRIDVLEVDGRRFCTVGGLGLVADCALAVNRIRTVSGLGRRVVRRLGATAYRLSAVGNILLRPAIECLLSVSYRVPGAAGTDTVHCRANGAFVTNQPTLGAGLRLVPASDNTDGVFEIGILPAGPRLRLLGTLARMNRGAPLTNGRLTVIPACWARIDGPAETTFFGDGEPLHRATSHCVAIRQRALSVIC